MAAPEYLKSAKIMTAAVLIGFGGVALLAQTEAVPVMKRTPGSWQTKITIEKLDGPGAAEGTKEIMQAMFDKQSEQNFCLTPEAAAKEDFVGNMRNSTPKNSCQTLNEESGNGKISISSVCKTSSGDEIRMSMAGTYSPSKITMLMKTENAPSRNGPINMHMNTQLEHVGECTPGQKQL